MKNIEKLQSWLENTPYEGVILGRRDNFKWVTQGIENAVVMNTEIGIGYLVIKKDGTIDLIADSSDCSRFEKEKNVLNAKCVLVPWYETRDAFLQKYCEGKKYASDTEIIHTQPVKNELVNLRMRLNEAEVERYREIGQECACIMEGIAKEVQPGQTEKSVEKMIKIRCIERGISPDCVLVGSDDRILDYRHPMAENKVINGSLFITLGGEKYGLNISMTRMVYYKKLPQQISERMKKTQYVFACMQNMMKDQMEYREYWELMKKAYADVGYPEEWREHHQGGPTGYGCREFTLTPFTTGVLREGQAYAWNPTIRGTKCEETTFLRYGKIEIFTRTKDWPCSIVKTPYGELDVADILIR